MVEKKSEIEGYEVVDTCYNCKHAMIDVDWDIGCRKVELEKAWSVVGCEPVKPNGHCPKWEALNDEN